MRERDGIRAALLITGGGTTAEAVIQACKNGELLGINPVVVIASTPKAKGLERASRLGVPTEIVHRAQFESSREFGEMLLKQLKNFGVDLVSQNGWLPLTPPNVIDKFKGPIINQHPAPLDPGGPIDFGGKGMHGAAPVAARLAYCWASGEDRFTESTVHYVTEEYDQGNLINVMRVDFNGAVKPVTIADLSGNLKDFFMQQTEQLQKRLLPVEHENVIAALRKFGPDKKPKGFRRPNHLVPDANIEIAKQAKKLAVQLYPKG